MSLALLIRRDLASVMKPQSWNSAKNVHGHAWRTEVRYRLWAYWHWLRAGEVGAPPPQVQSYKRKRLDRQLTSLGEYPAQTLPSF